MKRWISLLLAVLLIGVTCFVSGCDETEEPIPAPDTVAQADSTEDTGKSITDKNNSSNKNNNSNSNNNANSSENSKPSEPVPLTRLNGKTPEQLVDDTMQALLNATEYELYQASMTTAEANGVSQTIAIDMLSRKGEDSAYAKRLMGETVVGEAWYADSVYYVKTDEEQVKYEGVSFAQFCEDRIAVFDEDDAGIGEGIDFTGITFEPVENDYLLTLPVSEEMGLDLCAEMGYPDAEDVEFTLMMLFDANGTLLYHTYELSFTTVSKGIDVQVYVLLNTEIVSLNRAITVSAPSNASAYVTGVYPSEEE